MSGKQEGLKKELENLNSNLASRRDYQNQAYIMDGLRQNNPQQYTRQDHFQAQLFISSMNERLAHENLLQDQPHNEISSYESYPQQEQELIESLITYHKQYNIPLPVDYNQYQSDSSQHQIENTDEYSRLQESPTTSHPSQTDNRGTPDSDNLDISAALHYEQEFMEELNKLHMEIEKSRLLVNEIRKNISFTEITNDDISKNIRKGIKVITDLANTAEVLSSNEYRTLKSQLDSIEEEYTNKEEANSVKLQYINDYIDKLYGRGDELSEVYKDLIDSLKSFPPLYDKIQLDNN